ncbi:MAG: hypothetical protein R6V03_08420 [Kiritimatiellia bacterium]
MGGETKRKNINRGYMKLAVWQDSFVVSESNAIYGMDADSEPRYSAISTFRYSNEEHRKE